MRGFDEGFNSVMPAGPGPIVIGRFSVIPEGMRVACLHVNSRTFGNCQSRKQCFDVLYPRELVFNVDLPGIDFKDAAVVWDVIGHLRRKETNECMEDYDEDSCLSLAHTEGIPLAWRVQSPVLTYESAKLIHPDRTRGLTIGEIADIMGWEGTRPTGPDPVRQIVDGGIPAVGAWLARQCVKCLNDEWGGEDYESSFDAREGRFIGGDTHRRVEKFIDVSKYHGQAFTYDRFPAELEAQVRSWPR